jgi:hypothetical protein
MLLYNVFKLCASKMSLKLVKVLLFNSETQRLAKHHSDSRYGYSAAKAEFMDRLCKRAASWRANRALCN